MAKEKTRSVCKEFIQEGLKVVPEDISKQIIKSYSVDVPKGRLVSTLREAIDFSKEIGFPVVLKAVSPQILHKTELEGICLNINSQKALKNAFRKLKETFSPPDKFGLRGFLIEKMVPEGIEIIVGLQDDPQFGPVLMLGTGGILINLLDDVTFRVLPVSRGDIAEMINELKGKNLIEGYRGAPPLNKEALIDTVLRIGSFGVDAAGLYESVDFNPVLLTTDQAVVVDAKIILKGEVSEPRLIPPAPNTDNMDKFFYPQNVAVVGASSTPGKIGNAVFDSLANHLFTGSVYPINKSGQDIFGKKSYPDLKDVPSKIDLVVIVVDMSLVPSILDQCRELGISNMLIISGGGKELGGEREALEREIHEKAISYGIRIIGPNCIGSFNSENYYDAFFQLHERMIRPGPGNISFITQSGTYGCSFLEACEIVGISKMISYGNRVDVDEADMIAYLADDPATKVIACYLEGLGDGRKFMKAAQQTVKEHKKPIVVFKAGRTKRAAQAATSHTGAYGGSYGIYKGAFVQSNVITTDSFEELIAVSKALSMQPVPHGNGIAMVSNGAGPMVNAIDFLDRFDLNLVRLENRSVRDMTEHFPPFYIPENPVDITGSATAADYKFAITTLMNDKRVDIIMPWFVLQDTPLDENIVPFLDELNEKSDKPILCGAIGGPFTEKISRAMEEVGVPVFRSVIDWITAARGMVEWSKIIRR
nr:acyl-CoA synthetase [Desulfobacterales bacterium]